MIGFAPLDAGTTCVVVVALIAVVVLCLGLVRAGPRDCETRGHLFEPRFDHTFGHSRVAHFVGNPESLKETIYVKDVCRNCGKTIERDARTSKKEVAG